MSVSYPRSLLEVRAWIASSGSDAVTGRLRFAQYLVLCSIASVPELQRALVFKGGNALDFAWQPNRSTLDLDFTIESGEFDEVSLSASLALGLTSASLQSGALLQLHSVTQQPRGANRTRVTYKTIVGYALPDELALRQRMERGLKSSQTIQADISKNDPICAATTFRLDDIRELRICTVEDIVAEKLRALLQQEGRNRQRPQDVLDIALAVRNHPDLNPINIASFLLTKSAERDIEVTQKAFQSPELAERARSGYEPLRTTARSVFIPFDEAFAEVLAFVGTLPIPEE